jgi:hypothetical protein
MPVDTVPKWLRAGFEMQSLAYPCRWDGHEAAERDEQARQLAQQRRKMNEVSE